MNIPAFLHSFFLFFFLSVCLSFLKVVKSHEQFGDAAATESQVNKTNHSCNSKFYFFWSVQGGQKENGAQIKAGTLVSVSTQLFLWTFQLSSKL